MYLDLKLNSTWTFRMYLIKFTPFRISLFGTILNFITYIFRDIFLLIIQCLLAIISIYLIKRYFVSKKSMVINLSEINQNRISNLSENTLSTTQNAHKIQTKNL
jgi:hypothetical protein